IVSPASTAPPVGFVKPTKCMKGFPGAPPQPGQTDVAGLGTTADTGAAPSRPHAPTTTAKPKSKELGLRIDPMIAPPVFYSEERPITALGASANLCALRARTILFLVCAWSETRRPYWLQRSSSGRGRPSAGK